MHPFKSLLDFFEQILRFFLFESFWVHFDPKKALKNSQRGQKIWKNNFWRFNTYMHPFKSLLDFFEQNLRFFLIWVILGHFDPKKAPKNLFWTIFRLGALLDVVPHPSGVLKPVPEKRFLLGAQWPHFQLDYLFSSVTVLE